MHDETGDEMYDETRGETNALFNDRSVQYAAFRPDYPAAIFHEILAGLAPPVHAIDVGCGTGISTRGLAAAGAQVIGIDPNREMRRAAETTSTATSNPVYQAGTGERTGRPNTSADLILCAQSFHWFDADTALTEFRRVLRPNGRLALLWNVRDKDDPVAMEYEAICGQAQAMARASGRPTPTARSYDPPVITNFRTRSRLRLPNPQFLSRPALHGRAGSASYFPADGPLHDELDALFDRHAMGDRVTIGQSAQLLLLERE